MSYLSRSFVVGFCCLLLQASWAFGLELSEVFSDHMVLQRDVAVPIWGKAEPYAEVVVAFAGQERETRSDAQGVWRVFLEPMSAESAGRLMSIRSGAESLELEDVLVGEVWLCAGQSNMAWPLERAAGGEREAAASQSLASIRLFDPQQTVPGGSKPWSMEQVQNLSTDNFYEYGGWTSCDEAHAGRFSAVGYYFGKKLQEGLGVPVGLIDIAVGGTPIQSWVPREQILDDEELSSLDEEFLDTERADLFINRRPGEHFKHWIDAGRPGPMPEHYYRPGFMYQAGVEPFTDFPIAGIIWYQGESNAEDSGMHHKLFTMAVKAWRATFGRPDLPVFWAQLPGHYRYAWPEFREGQAALTELGHTGMAVTIDVGDPEDIHPREKQPVGDRLARLALRRVYQVSVADSGPMLKTVEAVSDSLHLTFNHADGGLELRDSESGESGFWIAGIDRRFARASASLVEGKVVLKSENVTNPVAVRYAWEAYPAVTLFNREGLPAAPFRSDDWPVIRVACVGDSITFGMGASSANIASYPAQLESKLGPLFDVRNYGVSGATVVDGFVMRNWERAFSIQPSYRRSIFHEPDVVVINLGINDVHVDPFDADKFVSDYTGLINSYRELPSNPRIFIWGRLAPIFNGHRFYQHPRLKEIQQALDRVAETNDVAVIDMLSPLNDQAGHFPDRIHPDDTAAGIIAETVFDAFRHDGLPTPPLDTNAVKTSSVRAPGMGSRDEVVARSLQVTRFLSKKYNQASGPMVVEPVAVPFGGDLKGNNSHFGWPVATKAGDALIVVFLRQPQHTPRWGINKPKDAYLSKAMMTRSTDGGRTWSTPVDMRSYVKTPTRGCRLKFGSGMVTRANGDVVLVSPYGVFSSSDQGASWEHYPDAYGSDDLPGPDANNGPKLIEHPEYGLVSFGHGNKEELLIRYSKDGGRSWDQEIYSMSEPWAQPIEPTGVLHEGALLIVARCHGEESFEPKRKTWRYMQAFSADGWHPLKPVLTTMRVTDIRDEIDVSGYGAWSQDTVALDFNPVTKRFEAVCTNRNGGGQGREQQRMRMTLNLWSIDPGSLANGSGEWRFEGTLLTRGGTMMTGADGMHPGGAVIDAEAGVQHIFVYLGQHLGPASIFRITRTLDTPELVKWLNQYPE